VAVLYSLVRITMESDGKQERLSCRSTEVFQKRQGQWVNTGAHVDSGQSPFRIFESRTSPGQQICAMLPSLSGSGLFAPLSLRSFGCSIQYACEL
jgi:hypothetical protein